MAFHENIGIKNKFQINKLNISDNKNRSNFINLT